MELCQQNETSTFKRGEPNECVVYYPNDKVDTDAELAWTNIPKKSVKLFKYVQNGCIAKEKERHHPTQKPIQLMKWCIDQLPKDCTGTILDPFMGSGSTLVACAKTGRHGIGIEIDEKYFNIACRRVEDAYKQGDLFI